MRPVLFRIPGLDLPIYSYGVMLGLSLIVGWYLALTFAERDGLPREKTASLYVWTAVTAIIGSRVLFIVTNWSRFVDARGMPRFIEMLRVDSGGLVAYGGFLGGMVGSWLYCKAKRIPLLAWADAAVPALGSGLALTRIGCFLYGCDYGARTEGPMGISFPKGSPAWTDQGPGVPGWSEEHSAGVHPTQLYESAFGLVILALLLLVRKKRQFSGQVFLAFVFVYGFGRSLLEIVRDDPQRGGFGGLSTSQLIGVSTALIGVVGYVYLYRRYRQDPEAAQLWTTPVAAAGASAEGSSADGAGGDDERPRHQPRRKKRAGGGKAR